MNYGYLIIAIKIE